jgi:hypothetical protein
MIARTCQTCGEITSSPWIPVCDRPVCRDRRSAELDAIVDQAAQDLRRILRAHLAEAGLGARAGR